MGDKLKDRSLMAEIGSLQIAPANGEGAEEVLEAKETEEGDEEEEEVGEEEDEEDEDEDDLLVTLGFAEKPKNPQSLLRHLFPSKAGGVPAWLDPVNLPPEKSRTCGFCGEPLQFLLQVYAPLSEKQAAFHRTLFMFMCPSMGCLLRDQHEQWKQCRGDPPRSVKVFRCQLPRSNPFYSSEPPKYDGSDKPSGAGAPLCCWCGTWKGDKVCGSCKGARYCSEKHQALHWRSGHRSECRQFIASQAHDSMLSNNNAKLPEGCKVACRTLWPEFEIVNEDECALDDKTSEDNGSHMSLVAKTDRSDKTFETMFSKFEVNADQKSLASFQERISNVPEQILRIIHDSELLGHNGAKQDLMRTSVKVIPFSAYRSVVILEHSLQLKYCRDVKSKPLWPLMTGRPSKADIPKCNYCRGPLCYEFQILPQLLYYFGVRNDADSLDWATIVVYTCMDSCEEGMEECKEECAWVQLYAQSSS